MAKKSQIKARYGDSVEVEGSRTDKTVFVDFISAGAVNSFIELSPKAARKLGKLLVKAGKGAAE